MLSLSVIRFAYFDAFHYYLFVVLQKKKKRRDFPSFLEFRTELGMISSSSSSITATGCCARWNDSSTKTLKRKFAVRALSDPPPPVKGDQHNNRLQHQLFTLISHKPPIQPALNSPNPTLNLRHAVASLPTFILPVIAFITSCYICLLGFLISCHVCFS